MGPAVLDDSPKKEMTPESLPLGCYFDDDLRAVFVLGGFGIVVISARRTVLTDSDVGKTLEMSGSRTTTRRSLRMRSAKRFGRALR